MAAKRGRSADYGWRVPRRADRHAAIPVREDGTLRLGVVADTHSALHPGTLGHLSALRPAAVLHAGDVGDRAVLDALSAIAPLYAVRGNIDAPADDLPDARTIDVVAGEASIVRVLLMHIAVSGAKLRADAARLASAEDASLVVCGHSHVPLVARDQGIAVFNPGSAGPRRFQLPILFGTIDVAPDAVRLGHFRCDNGARWAPGA